ncbi:ABC transporter ATP-binding protein [Streptomyces sp. Lzd4kr]|nr:ABC transporter ATP-binding protein [Streptomyces sp. Lzd4kr]
MADPLFGAGLQMKGAWASAAAAVTQAGFWPMLRALPRLLRAALTMAWQADRRALLAAGGAQIVQALVAAFGLLAVNKVLVGLLAAGPTPQRVRAAVPALLVVGAVLGVGSLARAVSIAAEGRLAPKTQRLAEQRMLEHAARVELAVLEDGDFHRALAGARLGIRSAERLTMSVLSVSGTLLGVVGMTGAAGALHPALVPLLVVAVLPHAWKVVRVARWEYASTMRLLNRERQKSLLADALLERGAPAEEIRVHRLAGFLLGHYDRLASQLESERSRLARAQAGVGVLADAAGGAARVLTYATLGWLLVSGSVALATAGTAVIAITRVTTQLTAMLSQFNGLYTHGLYVADYQRTLERAAAHAIPTSGLPAPVRLARIAARDVDFTYPGSTVPAVRGVDFELHRGEVVALVGVNGSGKSTLARLIAGLYPPQRGKIDWDGSDTRTLDRNAMFDRVAWIGQDFCRWPFTARVNTIISRPGADDSEQRLGSAAAFAGAEEFIQRLPDQWDTLLAKEFQGGVALSGGQWQRLALARAHYRRAEVLICDEPTAALDPMTEIETFDKLMALAAESGQTVLLITHRLGSIRYADRIYVLDEGRVVETGTHDQLIEAEGAFARMYQAQRHQYGLPSARSTDSG